MADGSDQRDSSTDEREAVVDTAAAVSAATFGSLPLNVSFAKAAYIESQAALIQRLPGMENFISVGYAVRTAALNAEDDEERDNPNLASVRRAFEAMEIEQTRTREREAWLQKSSTVAGVTMNNTDWKKLAELLRGDEDFQRRLLSAFMERGMSREEARERVDRVADVSAAMAIPPAQRTEEQKDLIEQADADPTFKKDIEMAQGARTMLAPKTELVGAFSEAQSAKPATLVADIQPVVTLVSGPGF